MSYQVNGEITIYASEAFDNGEIEVTSDAEGIVDIMNENNISLNELVEEHCLMTGERYNSVVSEDDVASYIKCATLNECVTINRELIYRIEHLYAEEKNKSHDLETQLRTKLMAVQPVANHDTSSQISN